MTLHHVPYHSLSQHYQSVYRQVEQDSVGLSPDVVFFANRNHRFEGKHKSSKVDMKYRKGKL